MSSREPKKSKAPGPNPIKLYNFPLVTFLLWPTQWPRIVWIRKETNGIEAPGCIAQHERISQ